MLQGAARFCNTLCTARHVQSETVVPTNRSQDGDQAWLQCKSSVAAHMIWTICEATTILRDRHAGCIYEGSGS
jgi:hypothetical protein